MTEEEIKKLENGLDSIFSKKRQFSVLSRYLSEIGCEYIASGSARAVYKLNNDKVLKIAKNKKGIAQNEVEADWALRNYGIAADWYDISDDSIWIESEFCRKAKKSDFKNLTGLDFSWFQNAIKYNYMTLHPSRYYSIPKPEGYSEEIEKEDSFLVQMESYMADFDIPWGDLVRISSYGINHNNEIVLVDYGLNRSVEEEFYRRK